MPTPLIEMEADHEWRNWHDTRGVGGRPHRFCTPRNRWEDAPAPTPQRRYEPGLAGLQALIRRAEADPSTPRVRALGSGWSLSSVAYVDGYLVNTARLTYHRIGLGTRHVAPSHQEAAGRLVFAQCGVAITTLNNALEQAGLALPTSGASNGQTIAGAISTGTHGSAHAVGAIHDCVRALHLVAEGGRHYVIQSKSDPVVTQDFANALGAEFREDDELFHAALVSFGSFGIIHGVVLEAVPLYLLQLYVKRFDYDDILQAATSHDIRGLPLAATRFSPYHIEFVLNPYRRGRHEGGAFLRVLYREPYTPGQPLPVQSIAGGATLRGRDLVGLARTGTYLAPTLIGGALQSELEGSGVPPTGDRFIAGTPGQQFGDSSPTGGGTSLEIGVPLTHLRAALDAIVAVTDHSPFAAPIALRYLRGSSALLAFTHFAPTTVAIEMPGIDGDQARAGHSAIFDALVTHAVPHTYHWGQALPLNPQWVERGFGARRERWLAARRAFLSPAGRRMFSNDLLAACGLDA